MSNPNSGGDQSMEDILASIRRIISEDEIPEDAPPPEPELKFGKEATNGVSAASPSGQPAGPELHEAESAGPVDPSPADATPSTSTIRPLSALLGENAFDARREPAAPASGEEADGPDMPQRLHRDQMSREPRPQGDLHAASERATDTLPTAEDDPFGRNGLAKDAGKQTGQSEAGPSASEASPAKPMRGAGQITEPSPFAVFGRNAPKSDAVSAIAEHSQRVASARSSASNGSAFSARQSDTSDDNGTSALERLRATMPTLRRPAPHDARDDSTPPPPSMRDGTTLPSSGRSGTPNARAGDHAAHHAQQDDLTGEDDGAEASGQASNAFEQIASGTADRLDADPGPFAHAGSDNAAVRSGHMAPADTHTEQGAGATSAEDAQQLQRAGALTVVPRSSNGVSAPNGDGSQVQQQDQRSAATLEDTVADMLRPMLRQWLDDNMPRIVARMMAEENKENSAALSDKRGSRD